MQINAIQNNMMCKRQIKFNGNEKTREAVRLANEEWKNKREAYYKFLSAHSPEEISGNENLRAESRYLSHEVSRAFSRKVRAEFIDETGHHPTSDYFYSCY